MSLLLVQGTASRLPLAAESVQCVVTSPPYWGLRSYAGEQREVWGGDDGCSHDFTAEPTAEGYTGTARWQHSANGRGEEQPTGKRLRDPVSRAARPEAWGQVERGGFCACGAWYGALGLEPDPELYVEHIVAVFREVRRVLRKDGTLWLNLGDSYAGLWSGNSMRPEGGTQRAGGPGFQPLDERVPARGGVVPPGLKPKDLVGIPWLVAFALRADGWWLRSDIIWAKPNPMPESVTDRPTKAHEYLFLLAKGERYFYDADAIREAAAWERWGDQTVEKYAGTESTTGWIPAGEKAELEQRTTRNKRSVWTIPTRPYPGAHFATFPEALVEPCVLAGSSAKACGVCGAPWSRVVAVERGERDDRGRTHGLAEQRMGKSAPPERGWESERTTVGWEQTCAHDDDSGASVILDPFNGSGTVGRVAIRHGRRYVGLDISREYLAEQSRQRIDSIQHVMAGV